MCDLIRRQDAIDAHYEYCNKHPDAGFPVWSLKILENLPSAQPDLSGYSDKLWKAAYERGKAEAQAEIVRCKDCKHWRQQTNYQGVLLSFGFCESDAMWCSLYGEITEVAHIDTDDDFYCGYAERRTDDR